MSSTKQGFGTQSSAAAGRRSESAAFGPLLIALTGVLLFAVDAWRNRFFLHDDSLISLRYAQNLLNHGELSWNLGDRVEGYTNFLYVLITAGLMKLGLQPIDALRTINALALCLLVAAAYFGARRLTPDNARLQALAVTLVLANVSLAVWLFGGLEAPLSAALLGWSAAFLLAALGDEARGLRFAALSGAAFALAVLTRPDAVVAVIFAVVGLVLTAKGNVKRHALIATLVAGIPLVVFVIHAAWRLSYYGDLVPNTFHAKVGLELSHRLVTVGDYLLRSLVLYLPALLCAGLCCLAALIWGRLSRAAVVLASICLGFVAYIVWSGGDHMAAARVLLPIVGPAALLSVAALATLPAQKINLGIVGVLGILVLASANARSFWMDWAAYNGSVVGRYIEEAWPPGSLVALNTAGSTPFFGASHRYIDMLGLNDREIALREDVPMLAQRQRMPGHGKGDGAYVLSRAPDYMILGGSEGIDVAEAERWFLSGVELRALEGFTRCYVKEQGVLPVPVEQQRARPGAETVIFTYYKRTCP